MFVAQLSDCHLTTGPLGGERAASFARALGRVLALDRPPDCVVVTGDLADHGRPAEYAQPAEVLAGYPLPFAGTTLTVAPSTYRAGALRFAPDAGFGYENDPSAFLVHLLVEGACVTHTAYVDAGAPLGGWL